MSQLPKGWVETKWDNIVGVDGFRRGPFGGNLKKSCFVDEGYAVYEQYAPINDDCEQFRYFITQDKFDELKGFQVHEGDFLISCSGTMGRITCVPKGAPIGVINQALLRIRLQDNYIDSNYFLRLFKSPLIQQQVLNKSVGGAIQNLAAVKALKEIRLPIAPLPEQKRIVEKLDEVLAQVDTIKARLDGIPDLLKRFRQSVLASAVSGKLTGIENGRPELSKLGDTGIKIKTGPFGSALHKSDYIEDGIFVINPMHINDGKITPSTQMTITTEKYESLASWHLGDGDVVVGRRGEMGRAAVVNDVASKPCLCGTGSMILRCDENIDSEYLSYIIRSPIAVSYFNATSVGSTMVNLNQKVIKNLEVYFPSVAEQKEIVRLVDQYFAFADTIEAQVKKAQARVDNLTQSILAKAFRGELVPQNDDDESAEVLLERIAKARKEAEALAKAAKKAGKKKA
ncbi:restriction endonuclease subunit S [Vibrio alginolyticus]|uniref:restriction endonuclease subunit S n=1 Tax=Vibrio sp. SCSIO 43009 TaxID=2819103 RepID=UPI0020752932|nr:restriction endonuclease subunit S [Vibrio sp. SCSIO 43009]USD73169.1 restriction endonuclease subunit S [Vibrio sp. SCSIO 43009]